MSYVIYGARGTGSFLIEAACSEIGLDYEVQDLDARNDEHRGATYRELNPHGKMPTLNLNGEVLTESAAILLTLDERHRGAELLPPSGSPERATALRFMLFAAAEMYPLVEMIDYPERYAGLDRPAALQERAHGILAERLTLIEAELEGDPYCLASGFSLADLYLALFCRWDLDAPGRLVRPRLEALMNAVKARPGAGKAWARHWGA